MTDWVVLISLHFVETINEMKFDHGLAYNTHFLLRNLQKNIN